jgi:hypothetical protein
VYDREKIIESGNCLNKILFIIKGTTMEENAQEYFRGKKASKGYGACVP